jgi:hypothetical protein
MRQAIGMVHRGDSVEVLDIKIAPGTSRGPVYAKLRAVLHPVRRPSRWLLVRTGKNEETIKNSSFRPCTARRVRVGVQVHNPVAYMEGFPDV